ncbi:hypothetical protein V4762_06865 [Thermodesulfobium sp. 4217-1]|uniref:hypothetical protein n=1 Tax=Thermodesulfobium sp. 4217-1 TaxID=3120013 RepID=UPI003221AA18
MKSHKNLIPSVLISVFFFLLMNSLAYYLGADFNWDLLNYHFYNGYAFLHGTFISNSLQTIQSYLEPLLSSFYYILISNLSPLLVNLIIASLQSISPILIFLLSLNIFYNLKYKYLISFLIALSSIFGPTFISEIGSTMGDTLVAPLIILSCLFMIKSIQKITIENKSYNKTISVYIVASGISLGLAAGLKLTNMIYVIGMFASSLIVFLLLNIELKKKLTYISLISLSMAISFLVIYAPVGIILYDNFKNPLFPFFNNIFKSPFISPVAIGDTRWTPKNLFQYFEVPFLLISKKVVLPYSNNWVGRMELPFKTCLFADIAIFVPFYFFLLIKQFRRKYNEYPNIFIVLFFIFSYIPWLLEFGLYRYIAALEILAPLVLFIIISSFIKNKYLYVILSGIILLLCLMSYPYYNWGRIKPFPETYFGIDKQMFKEYDNSMIIVGSIPIGFVIPYLPENDKIIAIPFKVFPFFRIPLTEQYEHKYYKSIEDWDKKIYYLSINQPDTQRALEILKDYKLLINFGSCKETRTNGPKISLCKMEKVSAINDSIINKLINQENERSLKIFDTLLNSSIKYLDTNSNLSNLYPQYLEENGYLDKSFGYGQGAGFNWTVNGSWAGKWPCPDNKGSCFGIGLLGDSYNTKSIIDKYKSKSLQTFFPYPKIYDKESKESNGFLLMVFRTPK